jgi:hypothetical protein
MATHPTTPARRISRLLQEGARLLAVHPGQAGGIDVTHDIIGLLDAAREALEDMAAAEALADRASPATPPVAATPALPHSPGLPQWSGQVNGAHV